jgi:serine/threonine protein kinase
MKIQNILLQRPDQDAAEAGEYPIVKLCDFGLSHLMTSDGGKATMTERCGTAGYIAPEVKPKNTLVGPEIDMWAFGVMLYEMCTAYKPTKLCNYRYGKSY